ncbi:hypothetical protein QUF70_11700, partial [Desulfobacterales bacterium HSG17]|nr:hypothetical protein [Desulfobacterales bacterium HSG17]
MKTLIYVHGTGTRESDYNVTFELIQKKLKSYPDIIAKPCLWGDTLGSQLGADGASIPTYNTSRGINGLDDYDNEVALWELLYCDPLYELKLVSSGHDVAKRFILSKEETLSSRL